MMSAGVQRSADTDKSSDMFVSESVSEADTGSDKGFLGTSDTDSDTDKGEIKTSDLGTGSDTGKPLTSDTTSDTDTASDTRVRRSLGWT